MSVISSNIFKYLDPSDSVTKDVYIRDNGDGLLSFYTTVGSSEQVVLENAGSVDYELGIVRLDQVQILSPADSPEVKIYAIAKNQRYVSVRDKILFNAYDDDPSAIKIITNGITQTTSTVSSTLQTRGVTPSTSGSGTSTPSSGGGGASNGGGY